MPKKKLNRSQKYHERPRHLYALLFSDGVYIGQTVNLAKREQQHRSERGGWCGKPFQCVHLSTIQGTEEDAVEYEHAWRLKAWQLGHRVFAKPPGIPCNPTRQSSWRRRNLARGLQWPIERRRTRMSRAWLLLLVPVLGPLLLSLVAWVFIG